MLPKSIKMKFVSSVSAVLLATLAAPLTLNAPADAKSIKPASKGVFNPKTFTLKNGMQVVVITNRRAPVVLHMVWYKVGAADEVAGKSGIAHFLEHLLFKGTKTLKPGEFSKIVAANGGRENAFTSSDYTGYYQSVAKDRLATVMKIEADRMANLVLSDEEVRRELKVVLEERRSRVENRPSAIMWEHARRALYMNHPYGRPVIGWMHELKTLTTKDALDFYKRHYGPNNAILIVAGDVSVDEVRKLAEKYYGPVERVAIPPRIRPQEPPQRAARRVVVRDKRVSRPTFGRMYLAPSYSQGETKHAYALQILSQIMGSGATSRIYQSLVVKQKLATTAGAGYGATSLGPSNFYIYGNPRKGVSVATLEKAFDAELKKIIEKGVTEKDVKRAKQILQDSAIFARDSLRSGAMSFGYALTSGRTVADVEAWPTKIGEVTLAQVNAAARYVFRLNRSVTAVLLPAPRKSN